MSRGRIVVVSPYRIEYGPPQTLAHVARAVHEAGLEPVCLVPDAARRLGDLDDIADVRTLSNLTTVPRTWNVARLGSFMSHHMQAAREIETVVHETNALGVYSISEAVFAASLAARRANVPGFVHVIGMSIKSPRLGGLAYVRMLNQLTEHFIACSSAVAEMLSEYGVPDPKIDVVHNGVSLARVTSTENLPDPLNDRPRPRIGMVAAYDSRKGHDLFVAAAEHVVREQPDATFYIIGGPLEGQPESVAFESSVVAQIERLGLRDRVVRIGYIPSPEVFSWIRSMDVMVVPSRTEAFAHVLVEEMACGRPVVATDVEGNLDGFIHGHSGLYAARDPKDLAGRVLELLGDPQRAAAMGRAAARRARMFDLSVTLPALSDAIVRAVDKGTCEAA